MPGRGRSRSKAAASLAAGGGIAVILVGAFVARNRILEEWRLHRLGSGDESARNAALEALRKQGSARVVPRLLKAREMGVFLDEGAARGASSSIISSRAGSTGSRLRMERAPVLFLGGAWATVTGWRRPVLRASGASSSS